MTANDRETAAARILADLSPVRPLGRPWRRALALAPLGALMALVVSWRLGVRSDAAQLGGLVLWGLTLLQMAYGLLLAGAALRTAVPGRGPGRAAAAAAFAGALGLVGAVTGVTWMSHASRVPAGLDVGYWSVCFRTPLAVGVPALLLTLVLAFRAFPTRPVLTGALAGLGAGLLADGAWRTFCEVSDPLHVATSHLAAVGVLTVAGMTAAWLLARLRAAAARRSR